MGEATRSTCNIGQSRFRRTRRGAVSCKGAEAPRRCAAPSVRCGAPSEGSPRRQPWDRAKRATSPGLGGREVGVESGVNAKVHAETQRRGGAGKTGWRCPHRFGKGLGKATRRLPSRLMRGQCHDAPAGAVSATMAFH